MTAAEGILSIFIEHYPVFLFLYTLLIVSYLIIGFPVRMVLIGVTGAFIASFGICTAAAAAMS